MTVNWDWIKTKRNTSLQAYCNEKKIKNYNHLCGELLSDQITPPDEDCDEVLALKYWSESQAEDTPSVTASEVPVEKTRAKRSRRKKSDA